MDLNELASRLDTLENSQTQRAFMDKYGTSFSNDEGIGVAILGELNRRGIDTSAADDAVQEILNGLAAEATALLDKVKLVASDVNTVIDKVDAIDQSVQAATDKTVPAPAEDEIPLNVPPIVGEGDVPPPVIEGDVSPPVEPPTMPPIVGEGDVPPPIELPTMPPENTLSDARFKDIKAKHTKPKVSTFKPSFSLLSSIKGGLK